MERRRVDTDVADQLEGPLPRVEADLLGARAEVTARSERLELEGVLLLVDRGRLARECRTRAEHDERDGGESGCAP
jgi:hypothetical protein